MIDYFKRIYCKGPEEFYNVVMDNLRLQKRMFIVTANPEAFSYGAKNKEYDNLLKDNSTTIVPDGIGIVKAARMLDYPVSERITGVDLSAKLFEIANDNKYKLALIGATEEVIVALKNVINNKYPNIDLVMASNGYTNNKDELFNNLTKKQPDICLVALGMPNQELLIHKHLSKFEKGIFVGVGGSFDVLSGTKKRAPKLFIKTNTEWLYRIIKEPKRIKRFYQNNIKFIFKVKKLKKIKRNLE